MTAPDPTPALPPRDGWFEDHLEAFERQLDEGLATDEACEGYAAKKRALWAAVVAYGDRRAEEARGALVELVREAWSEGRNTGIGMGHALHTRSKYDEWDESEAAERLAALSSPAPEGT